jgi:hypothetical protein
VFEGADGRARAAGSGYRAAAARLGRAVTVISRNHYPSGKKSQISPTLSNLGQPEATGSILQYPDWRHSDHSVYHESYHPSIWVPLYLSRGTVKVPRDLRPPESAVPFLETPDGPDFSTGW